MNRMCCPNCNTVFDADLLEEVINPDVLITKKQQDRNSWQEMIEIIRSGQSYRLFDIGDNISFKLKDGTDFSMDVAGFNIYGENNVILVAHDCLKEDKCMNERSEYRDAGGWRDCKMRDYLHKEFFPLLPDGLKEIIQPRKIIQKINGKEYESKDYVWLPSQTEMFAQYPSDFDFGDVHFPLFNSEQSRVKMRVGGDETLWYWLRTPYANSGSYVRYVSPAGSLNYSCASDSLGVAPACIIG